MSPRSRAAASKLSQAAAIASLRRLRTPCQARCPARTWSRRASAQIRCSAGSRPFSWPTLLVIVASRLPSSLSQFEKTIGHWRGCRCGDGESLVDSFQDKPTIEAPGEGAEVARQMFGLNGAVRGQEAVFDVGEQSVRPAERGVAR